MTIICTTSTRHILLSRLKKSSNVTKTGLKSVKTISRPHTILTASGYKKVLADGIIYQNEPKNKSLWPQKAFWNQKITFLTRKWMAELQNEAFELKNYSPRAPRSLNDALGLGSFWAPKWDFFKLKKETFESKLNLLGSEMVVTVVTIPYTKNCPWTRSHLYFFHIRMSLKFLNILNSFHLTYHMHPYKKPHRNETIRQKRSRSFVYLADQREWMISLISNVFFTFFILCNIKSWTFWTLYVQK